jgi:hypothetical protein
VSTTNDDGGLFLFFGHNLSLSMRLGTELSISQKLSEEQETVISSELGT